jgi:hypothetical protein
MTQTIPFVYNGKSLAEGKYSVTVYCESSSVSMLYDDIVNFDIYISNRLYTGKTGLAGKNYCGRTIKCNIDWSGCHTNVDKQFRCNEGDSKVPGTVKDGSCAWITCGTDQGHAGVCLAAAK